MKFFNPILNDFVEPVPLAHIEKANQILHERDMQARALKSKIYQALMSMDFNENDAEWVAGKADEIDTIAQENSTPEGLMSFAVDDLMEGSDKILFGPGTIGRLKRQQAWKANNDKIDKMQITEDYKRIFKELNPYGEYQERYDDYGNEIEGESWKPTKNPVNTVPINTILDNALKWAAKQSGGSNQTRWLDINGNVTDDPSKSATGEIFSTTTGKWESLSPDKLKEAIEASINTIPGARESLRQDYDIAKWKFNHNEESDIAGPDGSMMSPTEYINSKTTPFINAAKYYNQQLATTYGDALKTQLQLTRKGAYGLTAAAGNGTINPNGYIDTLQGKSEMITIKNTLPTEAKGELNIAKQLLTDTFNKYGVKGDINKMTSDEIKNTIRAIPNITSVEAYRAIKAIDDITYNTEYLNSIRDNLIDEDAKLRFDAYNTIVSGSNDNADNKYVKQYNKYVDYWYNGNKAVGQGFSDEDTYNEFIAELGGEAKARSLGIRFVTRDGKRCAELPKEYNKNLHIFTDAANAAYNKTHNWAGDIWNQTINYIYAGWGDNSYTIGDDGNIKYDVFRRANDVIDKFTLSGVGKNAATATSFGEFFSDISKITSTTARNAYQGLNNFMRDMEVSYDDIIGNGGDLTISNNVITEATPQLAELSFMAQQNPLKASELTYVYNLSKAQIENAVRAFSPVQHGLLAVGENGTFEKVSSKDRMEYSQRLKNANPNNLVMSAVQDPTTGNWGVQIVIPGKEDENGKIKKEPVTVFMPDIDSNTYKEWNEDPGFRAKNDINKYHAAGRIVPIVTNIFNLPDQFSLVPNGSGFNVRQNNEIVGNIDKETAVRFRETYNEYVDFKAAITSGKYKIIPEAAEAMGKSIATKLAELYGPVTEEIVDAIYEDIMKM